MSKFLNNTTRTVSWFKKANDSGELEMKPPFQRNPVWTHPQKSYLIDSILNGFPIPEIYIQEFVDETGKEKHIVIDGQQRIRACLEFIEGRYSLQEDESPSWANMSFDNLSPDDKKKIFGYVFVVRVLPDMPDEDIRAIFQRLNKNVVALNQQELRQATYWGPFITTMQEIANYKYWSTSGVFTPVNIRRMQDVEFISEISVAILHGHQNKKETLDKYYQEYEEEFEAKDDLVDKFQKVIFEIEQILPDIKNTRWRKKSDFYSLFVFFAQNTNYLPLSPDVRKLMRIELDKFAAKVNLFVSTEGDVSGINEDVASYAKSIRASSDLANRKRRHESLVKVLGHLIAEKANSINIAPLQTGLFDSEQDAEE